MIKKTISASRFLTPVLAEDLGYGYPRARAAQLAYVPRPDRSRDEDGDECTDETEPTR